MKRINVVGTSGTGKSTFSKRLAARLGHPHIEIDQVFWEPNWKMPSDEVFFARLRSALDRPTWILDGNFTRTIPIKWEKVDLVIWLDYSFPRTLVQAIRRAAIRSWKNDELWPGTGNRESFRKSFFSRDSIILWTIRTHRDNRKRYEAMMNDPRFAHITFLRFRSHREADQWLRALVR